MCWKTRGLIPCSLFLWSIIEYLILITFNEALVIAYLQGGNFHELHWMNVFTWNWNLVIDKAGIEKKYYQTPILSRTQLHWYWDLIELEQFYTNLIFPTTIELIILRKLDLKGVA